MDVSPAPASVSYLSDRRPTQPPFAVDDINATLHTVRGLAQEMHRLSGTILEVVDSLGTDRAASLLHEQLRLAHEHQVPSRRFGD